MLTVDEYMALRRLIDSEKESEGASLADRKDMEDKPKKRSSAYARRYKAAFRRIAPTYKLKSGRWRTGGFRKAVKLAHKEARK
tara:strand:+ start:517 stop:765 length:249 start_codon:yes stop_codon:yes gene_type:complete